MDLIYAVEAGGQETVLCSAPNEKTAMDHALQEWGITPKAARELTARVRPPTGKESLDYCWRMGIPAEMRVEHEGYEPASVLAFCKEDAITQAAIHWDADCTETFQKNCKISVSRRINRCIPE